MYNILRLFCENLKAIEVKLTEIYTCKSPPTVRTAAATTSYLITCKTLNVFFSHFAFSKPVNSSSKSTELILLKFCTLFLYINYEVTLSSFFFF